MLGFDFSMGPQHPLSVNVWITCWYHEFSIWKNEIHHFHPPSILLPANSYDWSHYPFSHQVPCHGPYLIFLRLSQGVPNWHLVFFSPAVLDFYCCISCYHEFIEASTMHIYYLPGPWEDRCAQLSSLTRVSQSNCWPVWCIHLRAPEKKKSPSKLIHFQPFLPVVRLRSHLAVHHGSYQLLESPGHFCYVLPSMFI